jgi:periplasmic protein TonB
MPVAPNNPRMADKKKCVRCDRAIDAYARTCPYCNWDQAEVPPPLIEQAAVGPTYVPPPERTWRNYIKTGVGAIVLLIAAFVIGFFVHGNEPPKNAPEPITKQANTPERTSPRADVTLIPVNDTSSIELPITSAPLPNPAQGIPKEYQRSDATAVSSVEYAQLAERAKAEKKADTLVDPRSLTGPAFAQSAPRRDPDDADPSSQSMSSSSSDEPGRIVVSTRPVPQYQPYPSVTVSEPATARLQLTIGPDGHVKEVNIVNGIPGQTSRIIETVQTWRFKPATENGQPVTAQFAVDLSFKPDD